MAMRTLWAIIVGISVLAPAFEAGAKATTHTVLISGMKFNPDTIEVSQGDKIVFKNDDIVPHTVTSSDKKFESGPVLNGKSWTYKAKTKGEFPFVCSYHPTMSGKITVK